MSDNNRTKKPSSENVDFISTPQYSALKDHFENVLVKIKDNEDLKEITAEFSNLLRVFQTCFAESQRKTQKILEFKALEAAAKKVKSLKADEDSTVEFLKNEINNLQRQLDKSNRERINLLREVEELEKTVDTQNKMIQVNERSLESSLDDSESNRDLASSHFPPSKADVNIKYLQGIDSSKKERSDVGLKMRNKSEELTAATLKNNFEIVVLDLKIARQRIEELEKEIRGKDVLVNKLRKDITDSENILAEVNSRISEITKPIETKVVKYKTEFHLKSAQFQTCSLKLEESRLLINQLTLDTSYKESMINDLKEKNEALESAKEAAERNAEVFERHLARSHTSNKELISEIKSLKDEILSLKQKYTKEIISDKLRSEKEMKEEADSQERTIDSLKNHIVLRDQKLRQTEEELSNTTDVIRNLKRDFVNICKQKSNLQSEISSLIKKLNDKILEMKYLKGKLYDFKTESGEIKRELNDFARKHQQVLEKKKKIHNMYSHMKFVNSQQMKENAMLLKRQEYLIKILKEKDIEIEKIVTWKR